MATRVHVCFGTGGVGKTTVSAALGTALAASGARTLVMTFDPARRLCDAFGVKPSPWVQQVGPQLACYMPEASASARRSVGLLFGGTPARAERLSKNPVLGTLVDGLSGMHELGALAELVQLAPEFDEVVIDTAPTRHALAMLSLPERVRELVESSALRFLADAYAKANEVPPTGLMGRLIERGQARLVRELGKALGGAPIDACVELIGALCDEREAIAALATDAGKLLRTGDARYLVVGTPRAAFLEDFRFFHDGLAQIARAPRWAVLNRAVASLPAWPARLADHPRASTSLKEAARNAGEELATAAALTRACSDELGRAFPHTRLVQVPRHDGLDAPEIVRLAARSLVAGGLAPRPLPRHVAHA
jgi:anion-transporting  ArsA/GET3 family ATPase